MAQSVAQGRLLMALTTSTSSVMSNSTSSIQQPVTAVPVISSDASSSLANSLSIAAESAVTFLSVFIVSCAVIFTIYSWRKIYPAHWKRSPHSYHYSALSQMDNDPDEEVNDDGSGTQVILETSSSDAEQSDNDNPMTPLLSKCENAPATISVNDSDGCCQKGKSSSKRFSSSSLLSESDEEL